MFGARDPLEALLDDAIDQDRRRKIKPLPTLRVKPREEQIKESFKQLYLNPDNWSPGKVLALVHRNEKGETTLLGAFQQLNHVRHCKGLHGTMTIKPTGLGMKLVRCEGPALTVETLFVTGDQWLHGPPEMQHIPDNPEQIADHDLSFDLLLGEMQVAAKSARIRVRTERGWTRRVCLIDTTQFFCPTGKTAIFLPKGTDVLEGMSFENKVSLKERLQRNA